jgi:acyl-CoA synthetase (AMP-forming)/AMP-acid ligase II
MPLEFSSWPVSPDGHPSTLVAAVARNAAENGSKIAVRERKFGIWQERNWAAVLSEVLAMAAGLEELGLNAGAALTVIGDNRPRLYFAMLAAGVLRAFPVPAFPDVSANELATYTLTDCRRWRWPRIRNRSTNLSSCASGSGGQPRSYTTTTAGWAPILARALYHLIA